MKKIIITLCMAISLTLFAGCGVSDVDAVVQELGIQEELKALEAMLYSGECWMACANDEALILYINGENSSIMTVACDDEGNAKVTDISGTWNLDETSFTIFSESGKGKDFAWNITQEEEITCVTLIGEGIDATFYRTQVSSSDDAVELAKKYISHKAEETDSPIEMEDITEVLSEYKGISIVDAFIGNGLEPSFKNRKIFAKKAGIKDYIGTAEQNLSLIEYMGGKLK